MPIETRKTKIETRNSRRFRYAGALVLLLGLACPLPIEMRAQQPSASPQSAKDKPFVVEYYYKAKWGHAEEFIALFKKNHYPVLKKEIELGRILKVFATTPRYHTTEDGRWDFRTTIVFKNAETANDNFDPAPILKQLFPDQDTYKREEQRRFEILDAHWDLPIKDFDLDAR
jgi:hypothetical protein